MKKLWILALCLVLSLCLVACGNNPSPDNPLDESGNPIVTTNPSEGENTTAPSGGDSTGTTTNGGSNAPPTTTTVEGGNVVDGGLLFTTTTKQPTPTKDGETTTTAAPTTTKAPTTTTVAPPKQEEVKNVKLPAVGYDMDGKGRIIISGAEIKKEGKVQYAHITFSNDSKKNGKEWQIPEYSRVKYACYDKNGKELGKGEMTLGALEGGDTITCKVALPGGTAELKITGHNLEYWTPWS